MTVRNAILLCICQGRRVPTLHTHVQVGQLPEKQRPQISENYAVNPLQTVAAFILVLHQMAAFDVAGPGVRWPVHDPNLISLRPSVVPAVMQSNGDDAERVLADPFQGDGQKTIDGNMQADGTWRQLTKEEEAEAANERLKAGKMNFDDFLQKVEEINSSPNVGLSKKEKAEIDKAKERTAVYPEYLKVMLPEEKEEPQLLVEEFHGLQRKGYMSAPRMGRIADETGREINEVFQFVAEYEMMRTAIARLFGGATAEAIVQDIKEDRPDSGYFPKDMNRAERRAAKKRQSGQ